MSSPDKTLFSAAVIDREAPVPSYQQVKELLMQAIATGVLLPHRRIPSERELVQQLGVSRVTVRQAIGELTATGHLYTRHGKGTFVAAPKLRQALDHLSGFTEDMLARGMRPRTIVLASGSARADPEVAAGLWLAEGSPVVRIERLRLADDEPMAMETAHLPFSRFFRLLEIDLARRSLYDVLRQDYQLHLARAEQDIEAALASQRERELLKLSPNVCVLRIRRVTYLDDGTPAEFVRSVYRGDRYKLHVELR